MVTKDIAEGVGECGGGSGLAGRIGDGKSPAKEAFLVHFLRIGKINTYSIEKKRAFQEGQARLGATAFENRGLGTGTDHGAVGRCERIFLVAFVPDEGDVATRQEDAEKLAKSERGIKPVKGLGGKN